MLYSAYKSFIFSAEDTMESFVEEEISYLNTMLMMQENISSHLKLKHGLEVHPGWFINHFIGAYLISKTTNTAKIEYPFVLI